MHASIGLRVLSEAMEPTQVTQRLKIEPSRSWVKGEVIPKSKGDGPATSAGWFLYTDAVESDNPADHFRWILNKIIPLSDALRQLRADGFHIDLCCNLSATEHAFFTLPSDVLESLGTLGLPVDFLVAFDD